MSLTLQELCAHFCAIAQVASPELREENDGTTAFNIFWRDVTIDLMAQPSADPAHALVLFHMGTPDPAHSEYPRILQALLQKMYRQWPFFNTLLSNMDMVMAKSDLALASRYAELVGDARLRKRVFTAIEAEWHSTAHALAQITGDKHRLANNAALQRSIRHRFPYIDPLHHLQVELVRRYRAGEADDREQRGIHISINGIAAGLRNTG